jgi:hypothetical protein
MKYSLAAMVLVGLANAEQLKNTNMVKADPPAPAAPADAATEGDKAGAAAAAGTPEASRESYDAHVKEAANVVSNQVKSQASSDDSVKKSQDKEAKDTASVKAGVVTARVTQMGGGAAPMKHAITREDIAKYYPAQNLV